jgi:hypothetical protein
MSFYGDLALDVDEVLADLGLPITIRTNTPGDYDPDTGTTPITTVDTVGVGRDLDYGTHAIDGTLIAQGDRRLLLSPVGMSEPGIDDLAIVGGVTWRITRVEAIPPTGVAALYDCNLRK